MGGGSLPSSYVPGCGEDATVLETRKIGRLLLCPLDVCVLKGKSPESTYYLAIPYDP